MESPVGEMTSILVYLTDRRLLFVRNYVPVGLSNFVKEIRLENILEAYTVSNLASDLVILEESGDLALGPPMGSTSFRIRLKDGKEETVGFGGGANRARSLVDRYVNAINRLLMKREISEVKKNG